MESFCYIATARIPYFAIIFQSLRAFHKDRLVVIIGINDNQTEMTYLSEKVTSAHSRLQYLYNSSFDISINQAFLKIKLLRN